MINPNKYIRKAIKEAIGTSYKVYDTRVPNSNTEKLYCILSTQSKDYLNPTKCGFRWDAEILLDLVCIYPSKGNTGSRVAVDDMENDISNSLQNITIPNFTIISQSFSYPSNLDNIGDTQIVYRNFIRISYTLE